MAVHSFEHPIPFLGSKDLKSIKQAYELFGMQQQDHPGLPKDEPFDILPDTEFDFDTEAAASYQKRSSGLSIGGPASVLDVVKKLYRAWPGTPLGHRKLWDQRNYCVGMICRALLHSFEEVCNTLHHGKYGPVY